MTNFTHNNPICCVRRNDDTYRIYGNVQKNMTVCNDMIDMNTKERLQNVSVPVIEYDNLLITVEKDGKEQRYDINAVTFSGQRLTAYDMMEQIAFELSVGAPFEANIVNADLASYIEFWRSHASFSVGETLIQPYCCRNDNVYSLLAATDKYLYYSHYDQTICLSADTKCIVTDNDMFALEAMTQSADAIIAGKETLIFGDNDAILSLTSE